MLCADFQIDIKTIAEGMNKFKLTKFQECNVICMVWKVRVDNDLADLDVLPEGRGEEI